MFENRDVQEFTHINIIEENILLIKYAATDILGTSEHLAVKL